MEQAWIKAAVTVAEQDRQAFVDQNAVQAEAFFDKWIAVAAKDSSTLRGDEGYRAWWAAKNAALGKDRRIAY